MTSMIPVQPFGRTGHESTRVIFGAAALGNVSQDEADQTIEVIRQHGINHIDTAASYGDAELRLGPWMETHRDEFFLTFTKKVQPDRVQSSSIRSWFPGISEYGSAALYLLSSSDNEQYKETLLEEDRRMPAGITVC